MGLTISNATIVTLEGMIGAQLLEFSPDITDRVQRQAPGETGCSGGPGDGGHPT